MDQLYNFLPIIKSPIWGTESWQVSGIAGSETTVVGGPDDGMATSQLIAKHREALVGRKCWQEHGNDLPLLFKFIDARKPLSIQVHPNDDYARAHGLKRGKTEMWYTLPSERGATLYSGLARHITPDDYKTMVADGIICDALACHEVKEGDVFYLPAGRVHSIGAGCRVAEIQQSSDTTYRIFDFNRLGADGKPRQLHTHHAAEAIDYRVVPDYRTHYGPAVGGVATLVDCPYFHTRLITCGGIRLDYSAADTFIVLMNVGDDALLRTPNGAPHPLQKGHSALVPAATPYIYIESQAKLIEVRTK